MSSEMHLEVTQGLHVGAAARLGPGEITIGAGLDCDVVLNDPGVAPHHLDIFVTDGRLEVVARDAAVIVGGTADVQPGFRARTYRRTSIRVGDAEMVLSYDPEPEHLSLAVPTRALTISLAAAAIVLASAWPTAQNASAKPTRHAEPDPSAGQAMAAGAPAGGPVAVMPEAGMLLDAVLVRPDDLPGPTPSPSAVEPGRAQGPAVAQPDAAMPRLEAAARAAAVELVRRNLDDITIEVASGALHLSGELDAELRHPWAKFQFWFDSAHAGVVLRTEDVRFDETRTHPRPPRIRSVWRVGTPYALIGDGRYSSGQALPGGWMLIEIRETDLLMSHGGVIYDIPLGIASQSARE